jgi:hypothetical protein
LFDSLFIHKIDFALLFGLLAHLDLMLDQQRQVEVR